MMVGHIQGYSGYGINSTNKKRAAKIKTKMASNRKTVPRKVDSVAL